MVNAAAVVSPKSVAAQPYSTIKDLLAFLII